MNRNTYEKKCRAFWYAFRMAAKESGEPTYKVSDTYSNHAELIKMANENGGYDAMWNKFKSTIKDDQFGLIKRTAKILGI